MAPDPKGRLVGYASLCRACVGLDMNTRCTTQDLEATTSCSRLSTKLQNVKGGRVVSCYVCRQILHQYSVGVKRVNKQLVGGGETSVSRILFGDF